MFHFRLMPLAALMLFRYNHGIAQKIHDVGINNSFKGGEEVFVSFLYKQLDYPEEATKNGIMGLCVLAFKVDCQNRPVAFEFKTQVGFGIEEEVRRVINLTESLWLPCAERDSLGWMNFKIALTTIIVYRCLFCT